MQFLKVHLAFLAVLAAVAAPQAALTQQNVQKYSLAVLNLSHEGDLLTENDSRVLTERLIDELAAAELFFVMSHGNAARGLRLKNVDAEGCQAIDCAVRAGKALGVQLLIFGKVVERDGQTNLEAKMVHIASAEVVKSQKETYPGDISVAYDNMPGFARKMLGVNRSGSNSASLPMLEPTLPEPQTATPEPYPVEKKYRNDSGGSFNWKYIGIGLLVAGGVGAGLLIGGGGGGGGDTGGNTVVTPPVFGDLPDPPSFP